MHRAVRTPPFFTLNVALLMRHAIVEQGAGVKARNLPVLLHKLSELVRNPGKLAEMSGRAKAISRPFAAKTIAERVINLKK